METTALAEPAPTIELWGIKKVKTVLGCSDRTVYTKVAANKFPKPVKDGRLNKWRSDEVQAFIRNLLSAH